MISLGGGALPAVTELHLAQCTSCGALAYLYTVCEKGKVGKIQKMHHRVLECAELRCLNIENKNGKGALGEKAVVESSVREFLHPDGLILLCTKKNTCFLRKGAEQIHA